MGQTSKTTPIKEPNWIKIFMIYLVAEPLNELKNFILGIPKLFNRPTILFIILSITSLIELITVNNKRINMMLFSALVIVFIMKEWKSGYFRKWYKDKIKTEQVPPQQK